MEKHSMNHGGSNVFKKEEKEKESRHKRSKKKKKNFSTRFLPLFPLRRDPCSAKLLKRSANESHELVVRTVRLFELCD